MSRTPSTAELAAWLEINAIDTALEAGLMQWEASEGDLPAQVADVRRHRDRLEQAWAARERYRARAVRLRRLAAARDARRAPPPSTPGTSAALPGSVAAILARAKAKAAQGRP